MSRSRPRHTTVPRRLPPKGPHRPAPPRRGPVPPAPAATRQLQSLITPPETSLLDVIDSLLNKGVVLNADVILALANVDLVYLRLSALLCAADRIREFEESTSRESDGSIGSTGRGSRRSHASPGRGSRG